MKLSGKKEKKKRMNKYETWAATSLCPAVVSNQRVGEGEGGMVDQCSGGLVVVPKSK